jgi:hypothetical protein
MRFLIALVAVLVAGCGNSTSLPTYEQLTKYPLSCKLKYEQFSELKNIQRIKNFAQDPDALSPEDRQYNALLKEHLWWFVYNCEQ